jgi:hypothetical protein
MAIDLLIKDGSPNTKDPFKPNYARYTLGSGSLPLRVRPEMSSLK